MTLTPNHIYFENECRTLFVGQTIRAVIYGEVKYFADADGVNIHPKPSYKTKYSEIDTLDHSIYFKTDNKSLYVFWDNTFFSYGLKSELIELTQNTNDYEQKWDVSNDKNWISFIGQQIIDFKIIWDQVSTYNSDNNVKNTVLYPQTFELTTENKKTIIISTSEFKDEAQNTIYHMSDNLLVTTDVELAKQLNII